MDPPYYGTEHYYGRGMFERSEFEAIAARLRALEGTFIMTLNDCPEVRQIFEGLSIEAVDVSYTLAGNNNAKAVGEVIITGGGAG